MKALFALSSAAVLALAGAVSAAPVPAEGAYIPGPASYGEKVTRAAGEVLLEREIHAYGLSADDQITVTKGNAPARVSEHRGR